MKRFHCSTRFISIVGIMALLSLGAPAASEGGDYAVRIDDLVEFSAPYSHFTWEQPPIEQDALSRTPLFCGWDDPSYAEQIPKATVSIARYEADDFRCIGPMPVTSIRWWGSYQKWQQAAPPADGPDAWRFTFWENTPADTYVPFSRPVIRVGQFEVPPDRVSIEWVGSDRFPGQPEDSCFRYSLALDAAEYFWPDTYEGDVFWLSVTALYKMKRPEHVWGWKTRPRRWMDGAVRFVSELDVLPSGQAISAIRIEPAEGPDVCGGTSKYDMAFTLGTDPIWIKWEQPFTQLRDWPFYEDEPSTAEATRTSDLVTKCRQPPDLSRSGLDVDATADAPTTWAAQIVADDYLCKSPGPVTQIDVWGSYYLDVPPGNGPANIAFTLSIREDIPARSPTDYSMPGKVLWSKTFKKGQFTVEESTSASQGFSSPCNGKYTTNSHDRAFQYTFAIDPGVAFVQAGTTDKPVVYWLSVQALITQELAGMSRFGWKTSASTWNDDAVWAQAREPYSGTWRKLSYPAMHPRAYEHPAMAFTITTSGQPTSESIERQVADDWKCGQTTPVVAATWWGSYLGYTEQACQCNDLPRPVRPDYFVLSIWSDVPPLDANDPQHFGHPGQKIWEYRAYRYDEVLVGSDGLPEKPPADGGREPVFRYSVQLPAEKQFTPKQGDDVYWFSVVAVYEHFKPTDYPWGWTNHERVFGAAATAAEFAEDVLTRQKDVPIGELLKDVPPWQPLADRTGTGEDMSFVLFQRAQILGPPPKLK